MSGGWNPRTGRDAMGGRPPLAPYGAPMASQGQPYIYHSGGPGHSFGTFPPFYDPWTGATTYGGGYAIGTAGAAAAPYAMPGAPFAAPPTAAFPYQPNGTGSPFARQPQPWPAIDPTMPAAQMANSTGGVGCEPGYNYFFPPAHTKVHVFTSNTPPWQLPAAAQMPFNASHIPCNVTLAELLKGFGCTNPAAKKNRVFEIVPSGGGKWYKGLGFTGGDKEAMTKTIADVGWDASRTGNPGEKPVVCLWFCRD
ncbi:hypothetical protein CDD83_8517 [Cordyceps sp. RAO-2017]|nr:hypothetical protein CDD83_8517 [Cordyceps sp. RAO-2017]